MDAQQAPAETGQAQEAPVENGQANEGTQEQSYWFDSAPDEVKGYIQNKGWDDPIKAVTSYQELEKFRGANEKELIKLPKEGESWDSVYDKLGRPESADAYQINAPEGMYLDEQRLNNFKQAAYKLGLNNEQVMGIIEMDSQYANQYLESAQKEMAAKSEAELSQLENEWGKEAFAERTEMARRAVQGALPDGMDKEDTLNRIEEAIGSANMIKFFSNIAEKSGVREDRIPAGEGDRPFGYTKEQALADKKALMSELNADPKRLANYNNAVGPDYDKMQNLLKRLSS